VLARLHLALVRATADHLAVGQSGPPVQAPARQHRVVVAVADDDQLVAEQGDAHGLAVVSEVMDPAQVALVARYADILQIGARNMQNYSLLREVGQAQRPVLLKPNPLEEQDVHLSYPEDDHPAAAPDAAFVDAGDPAPSEAAIVPPVEQQAPVPPPVERQTSKPSRPGSL
jgi:hypothetical protein